MKKDLRLEDPFKLLVKLKRPFIQCLFFWISKRVSNIANKCETERENVVPVTTQFISPLRSILTTIIPVRTPAISQKYAFDILATLSLLTKLI